ncbi:L-lactate dehydrogenase [Aldersonia sp. NBC_00410]|nr:L-lactate dehydrogenase [Aldersonia sp. NBC_00410]
MAAAGSHVAVVGAGSVGTTIAYACMLRGAAARLSIYDIAAAKADAEVLDLRHGLEFVPSASVDGGGDIEVCRGADVIVVTAGAKQKPGQSRLDLAATNAAICRSMIPKLVEVAPEAVILLVTNPVDVLTSIAIEVAELPPGRVFGSGTVLDSSRLRVLLAHHCGVAVPNVHVHIVGEHGDSELALWSGATLGGIAVHDWMSSDGTTVSNALRDALVDDVRTSAQQIIAGKGATNWAVGLAATRIIEAVLHDQHRVLPVSAPMDGYAGITGPICLSMPRIVGRAGAGAPLPTYIDAGERAALVSSAKAVGGVLTSVGADRPSD